MEEWIARGVAHERDEEIPKNVDVSMGYAAVGMAECMEMIDNVDEERIEDNLLLRSRMKDLEHQVDKLEKQRSEDLWTIQGLLSRMESMEMSLKLLQDKVEAPAQVVDLTGEEEEEVAEPLVGGPMIVGMFSNVSVDYNLTLLNV